MSTLSAQSIPILKGPTFAARLAEVCRGRMPIEPLPGLKHKRVLIPHLVGGEATFVQMGLLGQALRMRGAEVTALLCDGFLPACTMRKVDHHESACDRWCYKNARPFAAALGLPHRWYGELITADEQAECHRLAAGAAPHNLVAFEFRGIDLGTHVVRSIESYFKVGYFDLDNTDMIVQARKFLLSAMYQAIIGSRALDELRIDKVLMDDGKKVDWGVVRAVAAQKGIPVEITWRGLRGLGVIFERDVPGCGSLLLPEWEIWRDQPLTSAQEEELDRYMLRRETLPYDFRPEWRVESLAADEVHRLVGLPKQPSGIVFGMFPNIGFDAGKTTRNPAFENISDWIFGTIEQFRQWPQHHLVIKAHPAEARRTAGDPLIPCVEAHCSPLPANVHLLPPDTTVGAGSVVRISDCVLVYTSTVGIEAGVQGLPVVVTGGGWNAGRGFTTDMASPREYFDLLERMCETGELPPTNVEMARRYAYALCFRANLIISHYDLLDVNVKSLNIDSLAELALGRDKVVDAICRGILNDEPFEAPVTTREAAVLSAR